MNVNVLFLSVSEFKALAITIPKQVQGNPLGELHINNNNMDSQNESRSSGDEGGDGGEYLDKIIIHIGYENMWQCPQTRQFY